MAFSLNPKKWFNATSSTTSSISMEKLREILLEQNMASSGVSVTAESAMRCSTVFSCIRLIADSVAQLPVQLVAIDGKNREAATSDPLYYVLRHSPNRFMTAFAYWRFNIFCLCLRGFFLSQRIRTLNGKTIALKPIHPDCVIRRDQEPDGSFVFVCRIKEKEVSFYQSKGEVFFCDYGTMDGINPINPIQYNRETIGLSIVAERHGALTFKNGGKPSGVLEHPGKLGDEAFKHLKDSFEDSYGGNNTAKTAILEEGMKFTKLSMSNEDAQYLETRRFQKEEICGIFGVPPHMIGDVAQAKGWSTMEQMMSEYVTLNLNPWTIRIEQAARLCLIPETQWDKRYIKFMTQGLMRGDAKTRSDYYSKGIQSRWMTPNEAREFEDMNPIASGDDFSNQPQVSQAQPQTQTQEPAA